MAEGFNSCVPKDLTPDWMCLPPFSQSMKVNNDVKSKLGIGCVVVGEGEKAAVIPNGVYTDRSKPV